MSDRNLISTLSRLLPKGGRCGRLSLRKQIAGLLSVALVGGCATSPSVVEKTIGNDTCEVDAVMQQVDNPSPPVFSDLRDTPRPISAIALSKASEIEYDDQTLSDVLYAGLSYSAVLRDIGGTILRTPDVVMTSVNRQLVQTDPRFSQEAALSAFDAQLGASANFNNNDRLYNNSFFAGGAQAFVQDFNDYQLELSKRTASGSLLAVRGVTNYDSNNAPANTFYSAWDSWVEGEMRQPLLQGGGLEFNRIAGPGSTPGVYNGVLIAKVNSDISDADFQISLRDYISNVENAYWDLYLAFREYDARKNAYEQVLDEYNERFVKNPNADKLEAALVKQQVLQLKTESDEALFGKLLTGTQVRNGATGGTLQSGGGVMGAERRLRLLIGRSASDGMVIRPVDEPPMSEMVFDWDSAIDEALVQRPELQKQNNAVKKRELELLASKNFLNPKLDAVGKYRFRGFGDDLIANGTQNGFAPASAVGNLMTGDQQEWAVGVEMTIPLGYRKAHAAVAHAELNLARERTIQREQQREIISNLAGAFTDVERTYQSVRNTLDQYLAARQYLEAILVSRSEGVGRPIDAERLLDGHRRLIHAEVQFFRARAEYAIALKNIHYEKGSLLVYKDLRLADGSPVSEAGPDGPPTIPPSIPLIPTPEDGTESQPSTDAQPSQDAKPDPDSNPEPDAKPDTDAKPGDKPVNKRPYETSVDNPPIGASVPLEDYSSSEPADADNSENVAGITRIDDFADFAEPGVGEETPRFFPRK